MKRLVLELLAVPKAVPEVRRAVREYLARPCPEVQLCVSELLANVINHLGEGTPVTVRLARTDGGRARLEVSDPDAYAWLIRQPSRGRTTRRAAGSCCSTRSRCGGAWIKGRAARRCGASFRKAREQGSSRSQAGNG